MVTNVSEECGTSTFYPEDGGAGSPEILLTTYETTWCQPKKSQCVTDMKTSNLVEVLLAGDVIYKQISFLLETN
jgi:hypothetical protein